jgi:uncharacterized lipoprotein YajG
MKQIINKIFFLSLAVVLFASCKKDENQVIFEGGTAPVLTASSFASPVTLKLDDANDFAIAFNWTNPDYKLNTGISSQDVSYTLQFVEGTEFENAKIAEIAVAKELNRDITVNDLNNAMVSAGGLGLLDGVPHDISIRLKSTMTNGTNPLYSNVIRLLAVTPYPDPNIPTLWITGSACASNWTNTPPPSQKFTYISGFKLSLLIDFTPGGQYKFLTKYQAWQPQYGGCSPSGGNLGVNPGGGSDPDPINTPALAGTYKITVDLNPAGPNCTIVKQ